MSKLLPELTPGLKFELVGIGLITLGLLGIISLLGFNTGVAGSIMIKALKYTFGIGALVVPVLLVIVGSRYLWFRRSIDYSAKFLGIILFYVFSIAIFHHFRIPAGQEIMPANLPIGGGLAGGMTLFGLRKIFGIDGTLIVLLGLAICSVIIATTWSLTQTLVNAKKKAGESLLSARQSIAASMESTAELDEDDTPYSRRKIYNQEQDKPLSIFNNSKDAQKKLDTDEHIEPEQPVKINENGSSYSIPPLSILKKSNKPKFSKIPKEIADNARIMEETLENFGVSAKIINTCQGPSVTRYELEPAPGVKVSRIVNLSDDIALKLAAPAVRIEAPIPGKAAIGIEVPNKDISAVPLREVLESEEFQNAKSRLTVALGKDIAGHPIVTDLAKMPHLLVAGATGSGKSVCINTLITSILFKARPDEVKFILIDPKMVELSNYNGIPHLMTSVVTDSKKAAGALSWAVQEMERRYAVFATAGVRDIVKYNETIDGQGLPWIVIIIDELADLMMVAPVDVEDAICRLAQKARAAGMHLILATQRPSVDVITGTIKANVPSRISFAVSSQIDSRTILDMSGAEKLLGKGDMLFYPVGIPKPIRVQGAYIADGEVEELIKYIKQQDEPEYTEEIQTYAVNNSSTDNKQSTDKFEDELLEEATRIVMETGQASVSMLQRKFRIGYTRAARLIDTMEEMKIIGPNVGSKPRDILMTSEQVYTRYFKNEKQKD